ncbi:MAG: hypothetical protein FWG64_00795 [Firmicutes bacterium]|nr:hypothetical protein [Bacillota bacterium]
MAKSQNANAVISKSHIIMCEGKDDFDFISHYLNYLKNEKNEPMFEDFQILRCNGNKNLPNALENIIKQSSFYVVKSLLIIQDAEKDPDDEVHDIKKALQNNGFPVPEKPNCVIDDSNPKYNNKNIKVAFTLFPELSETPTNGTLEDIFIRNLSEEGAKNVLADIELFLGCLNDKGRAFPRIHKTRLHTYFSVTNKYVGSKLGENAGRGAFNFDLPTNEQPKIAVAGNYELNFFNGRVEIQ